MVLLVQLVLAAGMADTAGTAGISDTAGTSCWYG